MAEDGKKDGSDLRSIDKGSGTKTGGSGASAGSANTGARTGTGAGARTGANTGTEEKEKKLPGVASVKPDTEKPEPDLPEGLTPIVPTPPAAAKQRKPRKVNKAKKKEAGPDTAQLNSLIKSISGLVASRPGCGHWLLTDKEIESITTPLMGCLNDLEVLEKIGENSNQIALGMACISVFAPRIIVTVQQKKEVKKVEREFKQKIERTAPDNKKSGGRDDKRASGAGAGNGDDLPFYGAALY